MCGGLEGSCRFWGRPERRMGLGLWARTPRAPSPSRSPERSVSGAAGAWEASARSAAPPKSVLPRRPCGGAQHDRGRLPILRSGAQQGGRPHDPVTPQARSLASGPGLPKISAPLGLCQPTHDRALRNFRGRQRGRKWGELEGAVLGSRGGARRAPRPHSAPPGQWPRPPRPRAPSARQPSD